MSKLYFIRHAETEANKSGSLVKNYDSYPIIGFNGEEFKKHVLPEAKSKNKLIYTSKALRTKQTAKEIFGEEGNASDFLNEFDCSILEPTKIKFWEVDKETFYKFSCQQLSKQQLYSKVYDTLYTLSCAHSAFPSKNIFCVSHGLFIRAIYSALMNKHDDVYDLLNQTNFKFKNLDVLVCDFNESTGDIIFDKVLRS